MKRSVKYLLFTFFFCSTCHVVLEQNRFLDSLENIVKTNKQGAFLVNALHDLFLYYEFEDREKAVDYLNQ